jgi:hypothetical protein
MMDWTYAFPDMMRRHEMYTFMEFWYKKLSDTAAILKPQTYRKCSSTLNRAITYEKDGGDGSSGDE